MFVNKPWLRYFNEPEGGAGGSGAGSAPEDPHGAPPAPGDGEPLGEGGKKALIAERTRANTAEQRITELEQQLQARDDAKLTEEQKRQRDADADKSRVGELSTENATLQLAAQRLQIALEEKVPADWVARIQGATPDEMRADAQSIKAALKDDMQHTPGAGHRGSDALTIETSPGVGTLRAHAWNNK